MAKNVTKSISAEQHEAARKAAQARKRNGRGSTANRFHTGPSILELVSADRREAAAVEAEARLIADALRREQQAEAFAARQLALALESPFITKDRANGGVDGYARELTIRLVNNWAETSHQEAADAGTTRLGHAKAKLVNDLFDEFSSKEGADRAAAKLDRITGMLKVAESKARGAIDWGFRKAKAEK